MAVNDKRFVYVLSNIDEILRESGIMNPEVMMEDGEKVRINSILDDQEAIDHVYNTPLIYETTFAYKLPSNYYEQDILVLTSTGIVKKISRDKLDDNEFLYELNKQAIKDVQSTYFDTPTLTKYLYSILTGETRPVIYSPAMHGSYMYDNDGNPVEFDPSRFNPIDPNTIEVKGVEVKEEKKEKGK